MIRREEVTPSHTPLLVQRFDALRQTPSISWEVAWPSRQPIFNSQADLEAYVAEAQSAFEYIFIPSKFEEAIQSLPDKNSAAYLKTVRKYGLIYHNTYQFFSAEHTAPAPLHQFVKALGKLNDAIGAESPTNELAGAATAKMKSFSVEPDPSIKHIASLESLRTYARTRLDEVTSLSQKPILTTVEFHDLRKSIRAFMNLFQIPAARQLNGPAHRVFLQLFDLSRLLGNVHDEAVHQDLQGIQAYETGTHTLDELTKARIDIAFRSVINALDL